MNVREVLGMDDGMPVMSLHATIKVAFESKSGKSANGAWCFVPMYVTDETGEEIGVTWFDPSTTDYKSLKGRPVEISARKNAKNTLSGANVKHGEYKGKPEVKITVSGDHLKLLDEEPATTRRTTSSSSASSSARPQTARDARGLTDMALIAAVSRWSNGLRLAIATSPEKMNEIPYEVIQPLLSTFLIAATSDRSAMQIVEPEGPRERSASQMARVPDEPDGVAQVNDDSPEDDGPPWTDDDIPF